MKLLTGQEKNPTASEIEKASKGESEEDKKIVQHRELNELAYEDLILAINGDEKTGLVVFNIVNNCKLEDYPEGNCQQAWKLLEKKFQPNTATNYVNLKKDFTNSKLKSIEEDPDDWITELESIWSKMDNLWINSKKKKMDDEDFIIHVLSNLPKNTR